MWSNAKERFSMRKNLNYLGRRVSTNISKVVRKLRDPRASTQNVQIVLETDPEIECLFTKSNNLNEVMQMTHFTRDEIQLIYRDFKQKCPSGYLNEEFIVQIYSQFFPLGNTETFAKHIFSALSQNNDNNLATINSMIENHSLTTKNTSNNSNNNGTTKRISFYEFMKSLTIISKGSIDDKIKWLFSLYDLNKDGLIGHDEIESMINSIFDLMGESIDQPGDLEERRKHFDFVIERLGLTSKSFLSFEEFHVIYMKDPNLVEILANGFY